MKRIYLITIQLLLSLAAIAQVVNNGATIYIGPSARVTVSGTYLEVKNSGVITNNNYLFVSDSIVVTGNGTLTNVDTVVTTGDVRVSGGDFDSETSGTLVLAKVAGIQNIKLRGTQTDEIYNLAVMGGSIKRVYGGLIVLNNLNLTNGVVRTTKNDTLGIDTLASISNASAGSYVFGHIYRRFPMTVASSSFVFPLGGGFGGAVDYRPIAFNNVPKSTAGGNLILAAHFFDPAASSGAYVDPNYRDFQPGTSLDNKHWGYKVIGGTFGGADLTVSYGAGDGITGSDAVVAVSDSINPSNFKFRSLGNSASTANTVSSEYKLDPAYKYISLGASTNIKYKIKVYLQGALVKNRGNMQNYYKSSTLTPIFGPGGTNAKNILASYVIDSVSGSTAGRPVDVVTVYLRNASFAYVDTATAWVMSDGSLRDFNSLTKDYVTFSKAVAGTPYHIQIAQKNHITIMSSTTYTASSAIPGSTVDLTVIGNIYGAGAANITTGPFAGKAAMWLGNADASDMEVNANDLYDVQTTMDNFLAFPGYTQTDVVLDNTTEYTNADDRDATSIANDNLYYSTIP